MRTDTATPPRRIVPIEGPIAQERWGSVGFRLNDPGAPKQCREAVRYLLDRFGLHWIRGLNDNVELITHELIVNAQKFSAGHYPCGSVTLWHPNRWLALTVHDKNPHIPFRESRINADDDAESGRGLQLVRALAAEHCGEFDWAPDGDRANPGKVARVKWLMPDVSWPHPYRDAWTGKIRY